MKLSPNRWQGTLAAAFRVVRRSTELKWFRYSARNGAASVPYAAPIISQLRDHKVILIQRRFCPAQDSKSIQLLLHCTLERAATTFTHWLMHSLFLFYCLEFRPNASQGLLDLRFKRISFRHLPLHLQTLFGISIQCSMYFDSGSG